MCLPHEYQGGQAKHLSVIESRPPQGYRENLGVTDQVRVYFTARHYVYVTTVELGTTKELEYHLSKNMAGVVISSLLT